MGYAIVRAILNFFFFVLFGLKVEGRENVPKTGAIIVAPNHKSYWDPPVVGVAFNTRIIHYMAKEELFKNPFFGWLIRQFGTFPVKRGSVDRAAVRQAIKEITRIKREGLGRFHTGMASLALMTGTPVIPVAVLGTMDLPRKNGPLAVLIGKPIEVKKQRPTDEKVAELNDIVKAEIQKLMDDYKK